MVTKQELNKLNNPIYTSYLIQFHRVPNASKLVKTNKSLVALAIAMASFFEAREKDIMESATHFF